MNKAAIKAELRRSACEDESPAIESELDAYLETWRWREDGDFLGSIEHQRTFFLFVAEAL